MHMYAMFVLLGFTPASAEAPLRQLEAHCWHEAVHEGSFYCQFLMLMGKLDGVDGWVIPELSAPDGEEKTWIQAHRACERLGFSYSTGFELKSSDKDVTLARLEPSAAYAWQGKGKFIQHVKCE